MKPTFAGCRRSEITITPANWNTKKPSMAVRWRMFYRFYDPGHPRGKQISLSGMNHYKTITDRQDVVKEVLAYEIDRLDNKGYNPITQTFMIPQAAPATAEITPETPFIEALTHALAKITVEPDTRADIKSVLKYFRLSAAKLGKADDPLRDIKRKDIRAILDNCSRVKKIWTDNQFNHYRKYLMILYSELEQLEIIDYNPIEGIRKRETVTKIVEALTRDEAIAVDNHLTKYPDFRRFLHIFYHSGARISELMRVRTEDVDLAGQRFRATIKKGKKRRQVWKTIKDIALPYWREVMASAGPADYLFSNGQKPGPNEMDPDSITRRWKRWVKDELGITANFYHAKHRHTTIVSNMLGEEKAARHNDHKGTGMVAKIYNLDHEKMKHMEVKGLGNAFTD